MCHLITYYYALCNHYHPNPKCNVHIACSSFLRTRYTCDNTVIELPLYGACQVCRRKRVVRGRGRRREREPLQRQSQRQLWDVMEDSGSDSDSDSDENENENQRRPRLHVGRGQLRREKMDVDMDMDMDSMELFDMITF